MLFAIARLLSVSLPLRAAVANLLLFIFWIEFYWKQKEHGENKSFIVDIYEWIRTTIKRTAKEAPAYFKNHKLNCHATFEMATTIAKKTRLENTTRISLLPNAIYISIKWVDERTQDSSFYYFCTQFQFNKVMFNSIVGRWWDKNAANVIDWQKRK